MADFRSEIATLEASVDRGLRDLVRFGTAEQAEQAHKAREKLRLAQMDQALASLDSRNAAILALVANLQSVTEGLQRHPVGDALAQFRSAVAVGQLLLDRVQDDDAVEQPASPDSAPSAEGPVPTPIPAPSSAAPSSGQPAPLPAAAPSPGPSSPGPSSLRPSSPAPTAAPTAAQDPAGPAMALKLSPPNERFRDALLAGARRCGLEACALAALIDAEAARLPDGGWDPNSANPHSSARGLTQFLSATWLDMAARSGTFLNELGRAKGMLDDRNAAIAARRAELLDLRFDPEASILTAADFARQNLSFLAAHGCVPADATSHDKARIAYLAHHEGPAGARAFINGTLSEDRAERLLRVNAGSRAASLRSEHGSWRLAYENFLNAYIDRKIQPAKFRP